MLPRPAKQQNEPVMATLSGHLCSRAMAGRLGKRSLETLDDLAAWAAMASSCDGVREKALVRKWRLALETALVFEKADLLVQSLGAAGTGWGM